jgi:acyl-CoA dehydrogenase
MGVTNPDADAYKRQSMVLVPMDTPGLTVKRTLPVFGFEHEGGHAELLFEDVRVPAQNLLGEEGGGFSIAQARLGPGRIHHCMRAIGLAERAFDLMCTRVLTRKAFGKELARQGVIQDWIAEARIRIEQARLLTLKAAWLMDTKGKEAARIEISAIKVVAPNVACWVIDHAMQAFGAAGVTEDFGLPEMYAGARSLRLADGPDEVHKMVIARRELQRYIQAGP